MRENCLENPEVVLRSCKELLHGGCHALHIPAQNYNKYDVYIMYILNILHISIENKKY
jgi:hypothetical protein